MITETSILQEKYDPAWARITKEIHFDKKCLNFMNILQTCSCTTKSEMLAMSGVLGMEVLCNLLDLNDIFKKSYQRLDLNIIYTSSKVLIWKTKLSNNQSGEVREGMQQSFSFCRLGLFWETFPSLIRNCSLRCSALKLMTLLAKIYKVDWVLKQLQFFHTFIWVVHYSLYSLHLIRSLNIICL